MPILDLANGYYELPPGKLANVATFLEMREKPTRSLKPLPENARLQRIDPDNLTLYRSYFRAVGEDLMWFSRMNMSDDVLRATLSREQVSSFALMRGDEFCGLLELDYTPAPDAELAFFGLKKGLIGQGLGRALMDEALRQAWSKPITRLFVHTCSFDSPEAFPFYLRSGFTPYAINIEIHDDPRLHGKLPLTASPHVALLPLTKRGG